MKKVACLSLGFMALSVIGCTGPVIMGSDAAAIYLSKPGQKPPADTQDQIAQHESWCYNTLGDLECFAHPQDVAPNRLVNVDPQSRYPLDAQAYRKLILAEKTPASTDAPASLIPVPSVVGVDQSDEITTINQNPSPSSVKSSKLP